MALNQCAFEEHPSVDLSHCTKINAQSQTLLYAQIRMQEHIRTCTIVENGCKPTKTKLSTFVHDV